MCGCYLGELQCNRQIIGLKGCLEKKTYLSDQLLASASNCLILACVNINEHQISLRALFHVPLQPINHF